MSVLSDLRCFYSFVFVSFIVLNYVRWWVCTARLYLQVSCHAYANCVYAGVDFFFTSRRLLITTLSKPARWHFPHTCDFMCCQKLPPKVLKGSVLLVSLGRSSSGGHGGKTVLCSVSSPRADLYFVPRRVYYTTGSG